MFAKSLSNFEWKVEDNGFIYPTIHADYIKEKHTGINIRSLVTIFTKEIDNSFVDNWISIELLFLTDEIMKNGKYISGQLSLVREICLAFSKEFSQTGIYFANEGKSGEDFDGIRLNNSNKIWQFDYALIPENLKALYLKAPAQFETKRIHENWTEYLKKSEFE
jgi:hypothetical protein